MEDDSCGDHPDEEPESCEDEEPFPVDGVRPAEEFDAGDYAEEEEEGAEVAHCPSDRGDSPDGSWRGECGEEAGEEVFADLVADVGGDEEGEAEPPLAWGDEDHGDREQRTNRPGDHEDLFAFGAGVGVGAYEGRK